MMNNKMNKKTIGLIVGLTINVLFGTFSTQAAPILINGGFETGDFTGWTEVSALGGRGCDADWYVNNTDTQCQQTSEVRLNSAFEGDFAAYNSLDGTDNVNYTIEQTVTLGSVSTATLDFSYTLGWNFDMGNSSANLARVFAVSFYDSLDTLISDVFVLEVDPVVNSTGFADWTGVSLDVSSLLSSFANQTVTLVANVFIPEDKTGPGSFGLDAVNLDVKSVAVPSPSVLPIFALGLLMMIGLARRTKL